MRVMVFGAGGPAGIGFCRALRMAGDYHLIGVDMNRDNLELAEVDERHHGTARVIGDLVKKTNPDFVHAQPDPEVANLSLFTVTLDVLGVKTYLPSYGSIGICQDKWASYRWWEDAGLPVPKTFLLRAPGDVAMRMGLLGHGDVFLRRITGAGGADSFISGDAMAVRDWVNRRDGWGKFTIAEVLPGPTVTVQTLWYEGELLFSQGRSRLAWTHGDRGSALISETVWDPEVDEIAKDACLAIDEKPHGLWGVDMTRDAEGRPCLTEINIGRFFTTAPEFFAEAGYNIANLYVQIALGMGEVRIQPYINPLPPGLRWIRSMDREPVLVGAKVLA